jgi:hypothetical protein
VSLKEHNAWLDAALRRQPQQTAPDHAPLVPEQCASTPDNSRFCVLQAGHTKKCIFGESLVSDANAVDPKVDRWRAR